MPELAEDPRFDNMKARSTNIEEIDEIVNQWTRQLTRAEITRITQESGVICAPVQNLPEALEDPHMLARGSLNKKMLPEIGEVSQFQTPIRFAEFEPPALKDVRPLGADTDSVLSELIDLTAEDIKKLRDDNAIG